jgi:hypothetical protein
MVINSFIGLAPAYFFPPFVTEKKRFISSTPDSGKERLRANGLRLRSSAHGYLLVKTKRYTKKKRKVRRERKKEIQRARLKDRKVDIKKDSRQTDKQT